jgi:hypothetical protein
MGVVEGNKPAWDNDWETIAKGGDTAIPRHLGRNCGRAESSRLSREHY